MGWLKLDDDFDDNPKVIDLSTDGFVLAVTGPLYCARHLTDGHLSPRAVRLLMAKRDLSDETPKELVEHGLWHEHDHDCPRCPSVPAGAFYVHDYLDKNPTAETEKERRQKRAEAGRQGGKKSGEARRYRLPGLGPTPRGEAKPQASASANAQVSASPEGGNGARSKQVLQQNPKHLLKQNPKHLLKQNPKRAGSTPSPSPSVGVVTEERPPQSGGAGEEDDDQRITGAARILAERRSRNRSPSKEPIKDREGYLRTVTADRIHEHQAEAAVYLAAHPDAGADELADHLEPDLAPPPPPPPPRPPCTTCDGWRVVYDELVNVAHLCPECAS